MRLLAVLLLTVVGSIPCPASARGERFASITVGTGSYAARIDRDLTTLISANGETNRVAFQDLAGLPPNLKARLLPRLISLFDAPRNAKTVQSARIAYHDAEIAARATTALGPIAMRSLRKATGSASDFARGYAAEALAGSEHRPPWAFGRIVLLTRDRSPLVRVKALQAAVLMDGRAIIPRVAEAVTDKDSRVSQVASSILASMASTTGAGRTLEVLVVDALSDQLARERFDHQGLTYTLGWVASIVGSYVRLIDTESLSRVNNRLSNDLMPLILLRQIHPEKPFLALAIFSIANTTTAMNDELRGRRFWAGLRRYRFPLKIIGAYALILTLWVVLLWLRPVWLLRLNDITSRYGDITLPRALGGVTIAPRTLLLLSIFHYHRRVLDGWVREQIDSARQKFEAKNISRAHPSFIAIAASIEGGVTFEFRPDDIRFALASGNCALIIGEGGSGKTSMACQLARWAMSDDRRQWLSTHMMIPAVIDYELPNGPDGSAFLDAVKGEVQSLIRHGTKIDGTLFDHLLRSRRILVIVDRFSEMTENTRARIRTGYARSSAHALVVTSRFAERLDDVPRTVISPLPLEGNRLSTFMDAYFAQRQKKQLFDDPTYFDALRRLSIIVGTRDVTVLFAKLYADSMIAAKESGWTENLPSSLPDLMQRYLLELKRPVRDDNTTFDEVFNGVQRIAWMSMRKTLRAMPLSWDEARDAVTDDVLASLETRLGVIQRVGIAQDEIRFVLDPFAEYMAARLLVEQYRHDDAMWTKLLEFSDRLPGGPKSIRDFLLALDESYAATYEPAERSIAVVDALAERLGIIRIPETSLVRA